MSVARDKLINQASADKEPAGEILVYESLPMTMVPFYYDTNTLRNASSVVIPNSLDKHLQFQPVTNQNDGTITVRPPSTTLKWQFYRSNNTLAGHQLFEEVILHEAVHILGFTSAAQSVSVPNSLTSWDLFRVADMSVPVSANAFSTTPRELRPTMEATSITRLGSSVGAYKAARGTRAGGDGDSASHWRSLFRLTPQNAIGVMDPSASSFVYASLGKNLYTRADVEALDLMGWNVEPDNVQYASGPPAADVPLDFPLSGQSIASGKPILFQWQPAKVVDWSLFIYQGTEVVDDNPYRVYEDLHSTSYTVPASAPLPAGQYIWYVVGSTPSGYIGSGYRPLTITAACPADFNSDGFVNTQDFFDFLAAFFANSPNADFNHDTFINSQDFFDFLVAFNNGCP